MYETQKILNLAPLLYQGVSEELFKNYVRCMVSDHDPRMLEMMETFLIIKAKQNPVIQDHVSELEKMFNSGQPEEVLSPIKKTIVELLRK